MASRFSPTTTNTNKTRVNTTTNNTCVKSDLKKGQARHFGSGRCVMCLVGIVPSLLSNARSARAFCASETQSNTNERRTQQETHNKEQKTGQRWRRKLRQPRTRQRWTRGSKLCGTGHTVSLQRGDQCTASTEQITVLPIVADAPPNYVVAYCVCFLLFFPCFISFEMFPFLNARASSTVRIGCTSTGSPTSTGARRTNQFATIETHRAESHIIQRCLTACR